ncbi:hypothetical protein ACLOJK_006153 [Asimina triloba]
MPLNALDSVLLRSTLHRRPEIEVKRGIRVRECQGGTKGAVCSQARGIPGVRRGFPGVWVPRLLLSRSVVPMPPGPGRPSAYSALAGHSSVSGSFAGRSCFFISLSSSSSFLAFLLLPACSRRFSRLPAIFLLSFPRRVFRFPEGPPPFSGFFSVDPRRESFDISFRNLEGGGGFWLQPVRRLESACFGSALRTIRRFPAEFEFDWRSARGSEVFYSAIVDTEQDGVALRCYAFYSTEHDGHVEEGYVGDLQRDLKLPFWFSHWKPKIFEKGVNLRVSNRIRVEMMRTGMKAGRTQMNGFSETGSSGPEPAVDWELRPGGMLVQRRDPESDRASAPAPTIRVKVKYRSSVHEIYISSQATFGELKKLLMGPTGLHHHDQKLLFKDKERDSKAYLDLAGVKDRSKIVLVEDAISQERRYIEMRKNAKMERASKSISEISLEVDKLASEVSALESMVSKGRKVAEKDVLNLIELLMNQLIKLDGIMADGDAKLQRRMQVKRVQKYVETLDMLKIRNAMPNGVNGGSNGRQMPPRSSPSPGVVVTTKWETFDAPAPAPSTSGPNPNPSKLDWEFFD